MLVPADVVTVTPAAPAGALLATLKVAVICVALTTFTLLTVMPELVVLTLAPDMKFAPVRVTVGLVPWLPMLGLMEESVGAP